jgi:uncharacterized protein
VTKTSARTLSADAGPVAPATLDRLALRPVGHGGVRIDGGFWGHYQALNRHTTIPHAIRMLEETGSLHNLRLAASVSAGSAVSSVSSSDYSMPLFRDSDVYKVLEAIAWERARGRDEAMERFFADTVELLRQAQHPDGYVNSYVDVVERGRRFANPAMGHELYCAGHLLQAAVADVRTAGNHSALAGIAGRYADLIVRDLPGSLAGYVPGHPEIESALAEFARATGNPELVTAAADLIARRGRATLNWHSFGPAYFQDDVPFEQADTIRGHAVRALYLLAGATDVYTETGRPGLLRAALAQWDDMVSGKTYLTGGVGSRHKDEAFGDPFELPPDQAYCETCAAIASIMWNWRMLLVTGESRFADLIERTLYNGFLSGLGLDGASFFYVNALQARTPIGRQPWYQCACCPPNIMRLLASLGHYVATVTDAGVQIHQFTGGRLGADVPGTGKLELEMATGYPYEGALRLRVLGAPAGHAELAVRVPAWAGTVSATLNGRRLTSEPGDDRYLRARRVWAAGDELYVEFPLRVRVIHPDRRIDAVRSCAALERGPLVYCVEGVDVPGADGLADIWLHRGAEPAERSGVEVAGERVAALSVPGQVGPGHAPAWPYNHGGPGLSDGQLGARELTAIPYHARANRGDTAMRVWIPLREDWQGS